MHGFKAFPLRTGMSPGTMHHDTNITLLRSAIGLRLSSFYFIYTPHLLVFEKQLTRYTQRKDRETLIRLDKHLK